jgi:hypothetical protein
MNIARYIPFQNTTSYSTCLRFLFFSFFPDSIMAVMASKQQTTALFLSTTVTRTRRHTELTSLIGKPCSAREGSVHKSKLHQNNWTGTRLRALRYHLLGPNITSCGRVVVTRIGLCKDQGNTTLQASHVSPFCCSPFQCPSLAKVVIFTSSIQVKGMVECLEVLIGK